MQKQFLQRFNFVIFLMIAFTGALIQSNVFSYSFLSYFKPDFLLLITIYFGFKRDAFEGGAFVVLAAFFLELQSSSAKYFFVSAYLICFVGVKLISRVMVAPEISSTVAVSIGTHFFKKSLILFFIYLESQGLALRSFFSELGTTIPVQALLTPILFPIFHFIDLKTFKDSHSEDEYQMTGQQLWS